MSQVINNRLFITTTRQQCKLLNWATLHTHNSIRLQSTTTTLPQQQQPQQQPETTNNTQQQHQQSITSRWQSPPSTPQLGNPYALNVDNVDSFTNNTNEHELSCPWAWFKRPVDTRNLPLPRPLPSIYSDISRPRSSRIDMIEPWQKYLHIGNVVLCSALGIYMLLYMPLDASKDDIVQDIRKILVGRK